MPAHLAGSLTEPVAVVVVNQLDGDRRRADAERDDGAMTGQRGGEPGESAPTSVLSTSRFCVAAPPCTRKQIVRTEAAAW